MKVDWTQAPVEARFGRLTVLGFAGRCPYGIAIWRCRCNCGRITTPRAGEVARGRNKQCRRCAGIGNLKPGGTPLFVDRDNDIANRYRAGRSFTGIANDLGVTRGIVAGAIDRLRKRGVTVERSMKAAA